VILEKKVALGGAWFAGLSATSQILSWFFTMYIASLLKPEDYGLMTMGAFLTAYMEVFSELGLGSAIVQRNRVTQHELSSVFWLAVLVGVALSGVCLALAYPTSWVFRDRRVVPVTFLISPLFIIGSAMTVPLNVLRRDFEFKRIGFVNVASALTGNVVMVLLALKGWGVYTLIFGVISMRTCKVALMFLASKWLPSSHFSFREVRPYLRFGVNLAGSSSLARIFESLDKFIVGRAFGATLLGYYSFATTLASLPVDKIWPIFQQILFPLLSRYQDDCDRCNSVFLRITRYYSLLIVPAFIAGFFFAEEAILGLVGSKWAPIVPFFRAFCMAKLCDSLSEFANLLHMSKGKTDRLFRFALLKTTIMPLSVYVAARQGPSALTVPWLFVYTVLSLGWLVFTLETYGIRLVSYARELRGAFVGSCLMVAGVFASRPLLSAALGAATSPLSLLVQTVGVGGAFYVAFMLFFERQALEGLRSAFGTRETAETVE
jgi:O-antigen/teichoic acid export membrane protein